MVEVLRRDDPAARVRAASPEFKEWYARGLERAKYLALDERELRKFRENVTAARQHLYAKNPEEIDRIIQILKELEKAKINDKESEIRSGAGAMGYIVGLSQPLMGEDAMEHAIEVAKVLKDLDPHVAAHVIKSTVDAARVPLSAMRRDKRTLKILARMKIKAAMRTLPEIINIVREYVESSSGDATKVKLAKETLRMLDHVENAIDRGNTDAARVALRKYTEARRAVGHPVSEPVKKLEDKLENAADAKTHISWLRKAVEKTIEQEMERIRRSNNPEEMRALARDSITYTDLANLGKGIDLSDASTYRHWAALSPDHILAIEDVFDRQNMKISHLYNIHAALSDEVTRKRLAKILDIAIRFGNREDREAVEKIVRFIAENPAEFRETIRSIDNGSIRNMMDALAKRYDEIKADARQKIRVR